ncbi:MAG: TonB-dependent receptor [Rhodospirillaceae bacterium]|nr:TonB-dependent receptor [Rhodospirillaceae bacterium]
MKALRKSLLSTVALVLSTPAWAQLEEIVVTARKTEERLQSVPILVTAFTARDIEERGLRDMFDVSKFTPGFSYERGARYRTGGGGMRLVIHGQSNPQGESNVAEFVDGMPLTDSLWSFPFDIVERVEIIKGPQAALFGRATFAGAVNMITKKGTNEFENKISVRAAEYDDYEVNLLSRGPLVEDKVFYMAHGRWYDFGGMYRNIIDNQKVGDESSQGVNGSLEFRPANDLTIIISGGYNVDDDGHSALTQQDRFDNNCFLDKNLQYYCGKIRQFDFVQLDLTGLQGEAGLDRQSWRVTGNITYEISDSLTLVSNTAYIYSKNQYAYDGSAQGLTSRSFGPFIPGTTILRSSVVPANDPVFTGSTLRNELSTRKEWSQELRLQSAQNQPLRYMFGGYHFERRRPLVEDHFPGTRSTAPRVDFGTDRVDNWAVFGSLAYDFTDQFTGTAELRYARDRIGNFKESQTVGGRTFTNVLLQRTFKSYSPRFTFDYHMDEETLIYASLARGNKPGAINADPRLPTELQLVGEEKSWVYELGTKNTLLDGKLITNVSAYYVDWSGQQASFPFVFPDGGTSNYVRNAGTSDIKGVELELTGVFNDYFTGGFNYAMADAKYIDFNDNDVRNVLGDASARGMQLPNMSRHQFSAFGTATYPVGDEVDAFARADFSYAERKFNPVLPVSHTGDRYIANFKAGVETDAWNVTLFVDNVFDNRTPSFLIRALDRINLNVPGAPQRFPAQANAPGTDINERVPSYVLADKRKIGVTASYRF